MLASIRARLLWAVFCCLVFSHLPVFAGVSTLECTISADAGSYLVGQQPKFAVRITNRSDHDVYLVGSLDGSTKGGRYPKCWIEVLDSAGKPVTLDLPGCGNMNPLRVEDFVKVLPNGEFDPFDGFFAASPMYEFPARKGGVYTVRFFYSTTSRDIQDYCGDEREHTQTIKPEIRNAFDRISHFELQSNELKLTIQPSSAK